MPTFKDESKREKQLEELHKQEEEDLARILSPKYGLKYVDLSQVSINTDALRLIGEKEARESEIAAFNKVGKKLSIAIRSPNQQKVKEAVKKLEERGYRTTLFMVSSQSLERAWERYKELSYAVETKAGVLDISSESIQKLIKELETFENVKTLIEKTLKLKKSYRISRILEIVLGGGFAIEASDIHIEPEEEYVRLRYRLDGVLTDVLNFDKETYGLILSRIKLTSGLKLNVKNIAQDGRFSVRVDENDIEIRTSILPGANGESIVLRILNPKTIELGMERLGIEKHLLKIIEHEIRKPNGMILTTGPTGSGKTTALYAFMRRIHTPDIKIITIEDPVEYHLPGIVQTQVTKDYTFAKGLRSTLRQDPDVIMVGEIRDREVAETAINSALTGHLVFSTLHTNNAAGAFPRLIDLGVNQKVISSAINIVLAQRLIRVLCPECKKQIELAGKEKEWVKKIIDSIVLKELIPENTSLAWEAVGCAECNNSGYRGRRGIFEGIIMDEAVETLVKQGASEREIKDGSKQQGILTMAQDGIIKVLSGITSVEELSRVVDLESEDVL